MAQPNTQDTQKVFNSATENFKSFVGSVENVSNTKHMEEIYANMTKLFDAFTNGALLEQGANSETLLRTVYRSLNEDFLTVVQDTEAVDKLIEVIKSKQEGIEPDKVDEAMVSETTKKVVTKTLDPDTCDPMQVVVDFLDEIQTSILQVKLNLSREYERRRLEYAKSLAGQQEDLDKLKDESSQQTNEISDTLGQIAQNEGQWKDAHLKELSKLMEKFDQATGKASDNILAQTLNKDKVLSDIAKEQKKVDWDKLVAGIQGQQRKATWETPVKKVIKQQEVQAASQKGGVQEKESEKKPEKQYLPQIPKDDKEQDKGGEPVKRNTQDKREPAKEQPRKLPRERKPDAEIVVEKPAAPVPPKDELSPLVPQISKIGADLGKPAQKPEAKDYKLNVKPSKNGVHTCPICGYVHSPGGPHGPDRGASPQVPQSKDSKGGQESKITKNGILNTIAKVHENIEKQLNNKKFRNGFTMDYAKVQGGLQKQMKKIDKGESDISKDLDKTQKGIESLKRKSRGNGILGLIFGGVANILFTVIGGLILITLARMALRKWTATYMPKTDGSTMSIFGIPIPGWDQMKALGLGIWNFITVGIPNQFDKLKHFFGNVKKQLFGPKGAFRDGNETKNTLRKIIGAIIVANTKKVGGLIVRLLGYALMLIPGVAPFAKFLVDFAPAVYTFISTQIMLLWSGKKASVERQAQDMAANQMATGKSKLAHFKGLLLANARGVKPFKGQLKAIEGLQTSKRGGRGQLPTKGAIMRSIPVHHNKNFDQAQKLQNEKMKKAKDDVESNMETRLKDKKRGDVLVTIHNATQQMAIAHAELKSQRDETGKTNPATQKKYTAAMQSITNAILPQIWKLNDYINKLKKSPRFKNVSGPLYDPNTGWNRGYRVYSSDLLSAIPLNPFEAIHDKADIPIGQPAEEESESIGFMPFTWIQDGAKMSVHPILYELARAQAIRGIYERYLEDMKKVGFFSKTAKPVDTKKLATWWQQWNSALADHSFGSYKEYVGSEDVVLFKDRFAKFIEKVRAGKIQGKDNTLSSATGLAQGKIGQYFQDAGNAIASGNIDDAHKSNNLAVVGAAAGVAAYNGAKEKVQNVDRILSYDKSNKYAYDSLGLWERTKLFGKRQKRKAAIGLKIKEWRGTKAAGVEYGTVRDFWIESGALDLFSGGTIMGTAGAAVPLIDFFLKKGLIPKAPKADKSNSLHDLMHWFYEMAGIKGYSWKQVIGDEASQAGFAQVFLEHLRYNVLPQWNRVEKLLSDEITYGTMETQQRLLKGVIKINTMMSPKFVFDFMYKHLRFPNMKIRLVDYSNASLKEREKLDAFRKKLGIPDAKGKAAIIKNWQGIWGKIGQLSDTQLDGAISTITKQMQKAEFEARFSGDYTYLKQLKQFWDRLEKEKQARLDAQASAAKIVKKAGDVQTKVLEPPPKSMAEIEEEKRKQAEEEAKRKAEQERKEKEERERKLKEEAKRKEELAIANAKIKAMEAIRKQEENYESILQKMISDPGKVTDKELKSLGDEVNNLKQEAENQIAKLPREERELKLALIRGDKISEKTFSEIKETAVGLHGNLQEYIDEVNKIPVGSVLAIQNAPGGNTPQPVKLQDSDSVDLGDF